MLLYKEGVSAASNKQRIALGRGHRGSTQPIILTFALNITFFLIQFPHGEKNPTLILVFCTVLYIVYRKYP